MAKWYSFNEEEASEGPVRRDRIRDQTSKLKMETYKVKTIP